MILLQFFYLILAVRMRCVELNEIIRRSCCDDRLMNNKNFMNEIVENISKILDKVQVLYDDLVDIASLISSFYCIPVSIF